MTSRLNRMAEMEGEKAQAAQLSSQVLFAMAAVSAFVALFRVAERWSDFAGVIQSLTRTFWQRGVIVNVSVSASLESLQQQQRPFELHAFLH